MSGGTSGPFAHEEVPAALDGERVDRLVATVTGCSRAEASAALAAGSITLDGREVTKASHRVNAGEVLEVAVDPRVADDLPGPDPSVTLEVLYEDDDIVVIDKAPGLVVHPGPGHRDATLVNGLLARYPEMADVGEPHRPGLVHRLDRGTSGLLVVARTPDAHAALVEQLGAHEVQRTYTALVWGHPRHPQGIVDAPVGRSRRDPLRMAVTADGRPARTHYRTEESFAEPVEVALLTCDLETGRTHQIRVHLAKIGHPVVGDDLYGGRRRGLEVPRVFLHARHLRFRHPRTGAEVAFDSPLPQDLAGVLGALGDAGGISPGSPATGGPPG